MRLSYYLPYLSKPKDDTEAACYLLSLMMNTAVPFGAPYKNDVYPTALVGECYNTTNQVYYFNWVLNPYIIWIEFENLDFSGSKVLFLNPRDRELFGEVSAMFKSDSTNRVQPSFATNSLAAITGDSKTKDVPSLPSLQESFSTALVLLQANESAIKTPCQCPMHLTDRLTFISFKRQPA